MLRVCECVCGSGLGQDGRKAPASVSGWQKRCRKGDVPWLGDWAVALGFSGSEVTSSPLNSSHLEA